MKVVSSRANLLRKLGETAFVVGFFCVFGLRITPISWFPWDLIVTAILLLFGVIVLLAIKRFRPA
jgi:hypothetical protein